MNEIRKPLSTHNDAGFRWPGPAECVFICANVLMPYVLALILLAA